MSSAPVNPEIGLNIVAAGISTNYHEVGHGDPVLLIHGSGPGVSAWANWRLTMPRLATRFRVIAPDMVGFGFTERPTGVRYDLDTWLALQSVRSKLTSALLCHSSGLCLHNGLQLLPHCHYLSLPSGE